MNHIILFDGECLLCKISVQFIIKKDPLGYFKFASLKGKTGQILLHQYKIPSINSLILIENSQVYVKSDAALRIASKLKGPWKFLQIFLIVPRFARNMIYDFIAKNRNQWFGKNNKCSVLSTEFKSRFLD